MSFIRRSSIWPDPRVKPPYGSVQISRAHTLRLGLKLYWALNEGGGAPTSLTGIPGENGVFGSSPPTWGVDGSGMGLQIADDSNSEIHNNQVDNFSVASVAVAFRLLAAPAISAFIAGFTDGHQSTTYDKVLSNAAAGFQFYAFDGSVHFANDGILPTVGAEYVLVGTADGITLRLYRNGVQTASTPCGPTFTGYSIPNIYLGGQNAGAVNFGQYFMSWFAVWNRALRAAEVQSLTFDPWGHLTPKVSRRWFVPSGAGVITGGTGAVVINGQAAIVQSTGRPSKIGVGAGG